ncbi:MAG: hypothetical protein SGPRY_012748, partial [Prymnesium sp.]
PHKKRGCKMDEAFEKAILDQLVFTTLERVGNQEKALVIADVCHTHNLIITAAEKVKAIPKCKDIEKVQKLKSRRTWIHEWLHR